MGYNTVAVIMNDSLGAIEDDPEIGARISGAVRQWSNVPDPRRRRTIPAHSPSMVHCNAMELISQDHSSGEQVVIVHGNTGWRADDESKPELGWQALQQMQRCLERHGYKVTKPRRKKAAPDASLSRDGS